MVENVVTAASVVTDGKTWEEYKRLRDSYLKGDELNCDKCCSLNGLLMSATQTVNA